MHGVVVHTCTKFSPIGSLSVPPCTSGQETQNIGQSYVPVEHGVESRNFIHSHRWHFEQLRHIIHNAYARPSLVLPLAKVQEGNDSCLLVLGRIMRDDFIGVFKVLRCELEWNLEEGVR
jgi:hypothetical protein